jgi:hypothetical protein
VGLAALFMLGQRTVWHDAFTYTWTGFVAELVIVAIVVYFFSNMVFRILYELQGRVLQQN